MPSHLSTTAISGTLVGSAWQADGALLALRLFSGAFLVWGVWDNIVDGNRMREFVAFVAANGFPLPAVAARASVWVQFACGLSFLLGLLVRPAGLLCAVHFAVAIAMVHMSQDLRAWWPALSLVGIGLVLAAIGPGRLALDARMAARANPPR